MKSEKQSASFHFPVLLTLTSLVCLISYQVFGFNTAIGVATATTALALCTLGRKPNNAQKTEVAE